MPKMKKETSNDVLDVSTNPEASEKLQLNFITSFKQVKTSKWQFICYEDSRPSNWLDLLEQSGCAICISPTHDKDTLSESEYISNSEYWDKHEMFPGSLKKSHNHVLLDYESPTTYNNILNQFVLPLNAPSITLKPVGSMRGTYDYFYHKYNDNKYQYDQNLMLKLNGFKISNYIERTAKETERLKSLVFNFIVANDINNYVTLLASITNSGYSDITYIVQNNWQYFQSIIKNLCDPSVKPLTSELMQSIDVYFKKESIMEIPNEN